MQKYDNKNSGVLWKNSRKEKPTQPDLQGTIELGHDILHDLSEKFKNKEDLVVRVAAWTKEKRDGEKFFSLSIQKHVPKDQYENKNNSQQETPSGFDDEIPF
tara:strand:+ start:59 stop:364 length:306 start_codon:yes stop_codon:yes gene_type:complete